MTRGQRFISLAWSRMPKPYSSAPIFLILIAAAVVLAGSAARFYDLDRMLVWHDEAFSLLRTFGFDASDVAEEVLGGRRLKREDLLDFQRPSPDLSFADTLASLETHPEHSPLFYLAARAAIPAFPSPLAGVRGASALLLGLLPLAWVLWRFCARAPRSARLFLCALFLTFAAVVLIPDLISGGKRSLHPRYLLPGLVALELAVAYVLAGGWSTPASARRFGSRAALMLILGLGIWSDWLILRADTWWSKNFSAVNRKVAALVNAAKRPLLVITDSDVGLGEALSLAQDLDDKVVIQGIRPGNKDLSTTGFSDVFLLTPSTELKAALASEYDLVPVLNTWQWYRAVPKAQGAGT